MSFKDKLRGFIDQILNPPKAFLDLTIEKLQEFQALTVQGLNVNQYLSIFGDMPFEWQLVIKSLMLMAVSLAILIMIRSSLRVYFAIKDGVKWW